MPILAAVDVESDSQRVIEVGYDIATAYDETLVVIYVMSQETYESERSKRGDLPDEYQGGYTIEHAKAKAARQAKATVDEVLDVYDGNRITTHGSVGVPAEEIVAFAADLGPRFVVVGGRNRSLARQAILGSVSQSVVRETEQPVVTIMDRAD